MLKKTGLPFKMQHLPIRNSKRITKNAVIGICCHIITAEVLVVNRMTVNN